MRSSIKLLAAAVMLSTSSFGALHMSTKSAVTRDLNCGSFSGPVGQPAALQRPVIAEAVPWGMSPGSSILQAAHHGITGFSMDSAAPNIFPEILACSHALRSQGIHFESAVLLDLSPGNLNKQALHQEMAHIITRYMGDESYLHVSLGGASRPILFIYYGAEESDDPSIVQAINWLRGTKGSKQVLYLVDPGPDCRIGDSAYSTDQMLTHIGGMYVDDNCDANSQNVMSSDIRAWNQAHGKNQQRVWFASARADSTSYYSAAWDTATATAPTAITICSWNNPSYPDVLNSAPLLSITKAKSNAWRQ